MYQLTFRFWHFGFMVQVPEKQKVRFQAKSGLTKRALDAGESA